MNKNNIKKFAIWARNDLIARVSQRAALYGITDAGYGDYDADSISGRLLTPAEKKQRQALISRIRSKGYEQVMEEAAYTWFNRFCALRFMEANGYLPSRVRVFTNDAGEFKPQILDEAINLDWDGLDMEKIFALKSANDSDNLFKYLIITQCNALSAILPVMFQTIEDFSELLFPDNLLREGSVISRMISDMEEDDWTDQVQIIGWLYQYYNSEPKDKVFANLKKNIKISKENIPAATQLFTPDWIVRYMVENSLGRLHVERVVSGQLAVVSGQWSVGSEQLADDSEQWSVGSEQLSVGSEQLADDSERKRIELEKRVAEEMGWKYYLPEAEQEPEVRAQLNRIASDHCSLTPEHYKIIDPCMGSGHILVYAFDVLVQIYESYGYSARDAVRSIVENNLWGLDIDERAAQLAYFAVMMKARQYDRRFFSRKVQPHVYAIEESNALDGQALDYFCNGDHTLENAMKTLRTDLRDAREYGSILNVSMVDFAALYDRFEEIQDDISIYKDSAMKLLPFVQCAEAMVQKYHVVVTNPPYLGNKSMDSALSKYSKKYYDYSRRDLYAMMLERSCVFTKDNGYFSLITQQGWMFINCYETLRTKLINTAVLINMAHLGPRAFEDIGGEVVQTTTFVFRKSHNNKYQGSYVKLVGFDSQSLKETAFLSEKKEPSKHTYISTQNDYQLVPRSPIVYWLKHSIMNDFRMCDSVKKHFYSCYGLLTGHDDGFIFNWFELCKNDIATDCMSLEQFNDSCKKYVPLQKGGSYRKWYGNRNLVVRYDTTALIKMSQYDEYSSNGISYYFKEGITWTEVCMGNLSVRYMPVGGIFSLKSPSMFHANKNELLKLMGYLNTNVVKFFVQALNPTISCGNGVLGRLPIKGIEFVSADTVEQNIAYSKSDWDAFETSWDFRTHPLVKNRMSGAFAWGDNAPKCRLSGAYKAWELECEARFTQLKANEEELNRIFIDIYGLQDELTPEVEDKDVTVRKADLQRDVKSLISYAVGCMFGRYSLAQDGLVYAGGAWSDQWAVVSDQYYLRKEVENCVRAELSGIDCMAEVDGFGCRGVSAGEDATEGRNVCAVRPDAQSSGFHSVQYCRGTGTKLYEGISELPVHCTGVESGAGNTAYDLCSPEILDAISSGSCAELVQRGWKDAERIDWAAVHCALTTDHYCPDKDNIIPICDDEYFEDDIVGRFVEFIRTVYGEATLEENLQFIADALGGKGSPRQVIRNYFLNDFYKDHCKIYQKRPIYWLFDSGKKNGFKCLIYLHRYERDTIARIRTDYVHEQQSRYRTAIADLEQRVAGAKTSERVKLNKQLKKLTEQAEELRKYEEKVHHLADQMIEIDLDDGVKVNYERFKDVLGKIK